MLEASADSATLVAGSRHYRPQCSASSMGNIGIAIHLSTDFLTEIAEPIAKKHFSVGFRAWLESVSQKFQEQLGQVTPSDKVGVQDLTQQVGLAKRIWRDRSCPTLLFTQKRV
jgi:hypothetical protein